jgi:hypothetical protein
VVVVVESEVVAAAGGVRAVRDSEDVRRPRGAVVVVVVITIGTERDISLSTDEESAPVGSDCITEVVVILSAAREEFSEFGEDSETEIVDVDVSRADITAPGNRFALVCPDPEVDATQGDFVKRNRTTEVGPGCRIRREDLLELDGVRDVVVEKEGLSRPRSARRAYEEIGVVDCNSRPEEVTARTRGRGECVVKCVDVIREIEDVAASGTCTDSIVGRGADNHELVLDCERRPCVVVVNTGDGETPVKRD